MNIDTIDVVIYHGNCSDGIAACWCVLESYPNVILIPYLLNNHQSILDSYDFTNKTVIFTDCCFPTSHLNVICINAKHVIILDHHKTNIDNLQDFESKNLTKILDIERSGCQIAYDFIFGNTSRYWFIDYIGDRDLWKFSLKNSKEINLGMFELGYISLQGLTILKNHSDDILGLLLKTGDILMQKQQFDLNLKSLSAVQAEFTTKNGVYKTYLCIGSSKNRSDLGNLLAHKTMPNNLLPDFATIIRYDIKKNRWYASLRSNGQIDLTQICHDYGAGGGHSKSAGIEFVGSNINEYFKILPDQINTNISNMNNDELINMFCNNSIINKNIEKEMINAVQYATECLIVLKKGWLVYKQLYLEDDLNVANKLANRHINNTDPNFVCTYNYDLITQQWGYRIYGDDEQVIGKSLNVSIKLYNCYYEFSNVIAVKELFEVFC